MGLPIEFGPTIKKGNYSGRRRGALNRPGCDAAFLNNKKTFVTHSGTAAVISDIQNDHVDVMFGDDGCGQPSP